MSSFSGLSSLWGGFSQRLTWSLDELLQKENAQVEEILDDEEVINEMKNMNPKLIDFFTQKKENLKKLVSFIVEEPKNLLDIKRCYKYPLLASEIFDLELSAITNAFFKENLFYGLPTRMGDSLEENGEKNILKYLFSFLKNESFNVTLTGYFQKLFQILINKRSKEVVDELYNSPQLIENVLKNISIRSAAEVLLRIIGIDSTTTCFDERNDEALRIKLNVFQRLIDIALDKVADNEEGINSTYVICEIVSKYSLITDGKELLDLLFEQRNLNRYFERIKEKQNLANIFQILINLVKYYCPFDSEILLSEYGLDKSEEKQFIFKRNYDDVPFIITLVDNFSSISDCILTELDSKFKSANGSVVNPVGKSKLRLIEMIDYCLKINSEKLNAAIFSTKSIENILVLFFENEWNNILHTLVEKTLINIFNRFDQKQIKSVFEDSNLLNHLVENTRELYTYFPKSKRKIKKGHLGYTVKIMNFINEQSKFRPLIAEYIEKDAEYKVFCNTTLKELNDLNNRVIGADNNTGIEGVHNLTSLDPSSSIPTLLTGSEININHVILSHGYQQSTFQNPISHDIANQDYMGEANDNLHQHEELGNYDDGGYENEDDDEIPYEFNEIRDKLHATEKLNIKSMKDSHDFAVEKLIKQASPPLNKEDPIESADSNQQQSEFIIEEPIKQNPEMEVEIVYNEEGKTVVGNEEKDIPKDDVQKMEEEPEDLHTLKNNTLIINSSEKQEEKAGATNVAVSNFNKEEEKSSQNISNYNNNNTTKLKENCPEKSSEIWTECSNKNNAEQSDRISDVSSIGLEPYSACEDMRSIDSSFDVDRGVMSKSMIDFKNRSNNSSMFGSQFFDKKIKIIMKKTKKPHAAGVEERKSTSSQSETKNENISINQRMSLGPGDNHKFKKITTKDKEFLSKLNEQIECVKKEMSMSDMILNELNSVGKEIHVDDEEDFEFSKPEPHLKS